MTRDSLTFDMTSPYSCNVHFKRFDTFTCTNASHLVCTSLLSLAVMKPFALLMSLVILSRLVNIIRADRRLSSRLIRRLALQSLVGTSSRSLSHQILEEFPSVWQVVRPDVRQIRFCWYSRHFDFSCTYKYFTFTCRVFLDKLCLCATALAALASHRRLILALLSRAVHLRILLRARRTCFHRCSAHACLATVRSFR